MSIPTVNVNTPRRSSSLGVAGLVLGILGLLICWIPLIALLGVPLSALGLLLGLVGLLVAIARNGEGIGFSIGACAVSGLALFVALVPIYAAGKVVDSLAKQAERTRPASAPAPPRTEKPEEQWADATDTVTLGNVAVRITSARVGKVTLRREFDGSNSKSADPLLTIEVEISNVGANTKVQYRTFMGRAVSFTNDYAVLRDNFDNVYQRIDFGLSAKPAGATESASVYPGKSITDVLVFERPIETVEHLNLVLPAQSFGGNGMLRIRIPSSVITWPGDTEQAVPDRHEPNSEQPPKGAQPPRPKPAPLCGPVRRGDVKVSLTSASIGKVGLIAVSTGKEFESSDRYLRIAIEVTSVDWRPIDFSTWRGSAVSLRDDRGAVCNLRDFSSTYSVSGATERAVLGFGDSVTDVLVFDRPAARFSTLTLELPTANFGRDDDPIRFEIPATAIKR